MIKKNPVLCVAIIFIVGALFFLASTYSIKETHLVGSGVGPRFFPRLTLISIIFTSVLLAFNALRNPEKQKETKISSPKEKKRLLGVLILSLLLGFSFSWIGGYTTIFLYVLFFLLIWGQRNLKTVLLTPMLVTLSIYLLFYQLLSVRMPRGLIDSLFL